LKSALANIPSSNSTEPTYARLFRLVAENVIPDFYRLEISEALRRETSPTVADLLRKVARQAVDERDDIAFALHAYQTLLQLPSDAATTSRIEEERDHFQRQFLRRKEKEIRFENATEIFALNAQGIVWNELRFNWSEISAIRYGRSVARENGGQRDDLQIAWQSGEATHVLSAENFFATPHLGQGNYGRVVEALLFFAMPRLVARYVVDIRNGATFWVGQTAIVAEGAILETKMRLFKKEELVALVRLKHWSEEGKWIIASLDNPRMQAKYSIMDTWNAAIAGSVIETLAGQSQ
jgi:hypothetical protein